MIIWKMLSYCLKCRKNTNVKAQKLKNKKWKNDDYIKICSLWEKKLKFYKEQEASELLHNLPGIELPILSD